VLIKWDKIELRKIICCCVIGCNYCLLKGLVNPKMKIKSLITHPHAVPTP